MKRFSGDDGGASAAGDNACGCAAASGMRSISVVISVAGAQTARWRLGRIALQLLPAMAKMYIANGLCADCTQDKRARREKNSVREQR